MSDTGSNVLNIKIQYYTLHRLLEKRWDNLAKKGLSVWIFSSLTFVSVAHLVEAIYVLISGSRINLLRIYPFVGETLSKIPSTTYLWITAVASLIFWGITCAMAFANPMQEFLEKVLADAKKQTVAESQLVQDKSEVLDAMYETMESSSETIASVKDLICNVRAEVKEIQPLATTVDLVRLELNDLAKEVEKLEGKMQYSYVCLSCGKPLLPEFKICPYCGEDAKLLRTPIIAVADQK
jgi:rRNA maturation endonuclease Nob1